MNDPNDPASGATGTTWVYEYDRGGNMTAAKRYAYTVGTLGTVLATKAYSYGDDNWKDKLTQLDGVNVGYDGIGNMTSCQGRTLTWEHGRRLQQTVEGTTTVAFRYGYDGMRTHKDVTVGGVVTTTTYTYNGKLLTHYTRGACTQHFYYDAQGRPAMVKYTSGGTTAYYTYVYNLQGDVVGLFDSANTLVVKYSYDAWGKPFDPTGTMAATLGVENPFRYRGYVYDGETGYYYLRSRYYDPELRRFINADSIIIPGLIKLNAFAYCINNPVLYVDYSGAMMLEYYAGGASNFSPSGDYDIWGNKKTPKLGVKEAIKRASEWINNTIIPKLDEAISKTEDLLKWVGQEIISTYRSGVQSDILTAQLQATAAKNVATWFSEHWKSVVDWATGLYGTALGVVAVLDGFKVTAIMVAIPGVGAGYIAVAGLAASVWGIGRLAEWW